MSADVYAYLKNRTERTGFVFARPDGRPTGDFYGKVIRCICDTHLAPSTLRAAVDMLQRSERSETAGGGRLEKIEKVGGEESERIRKSDRELLERLEKLAG